MNEYDVVEKVLREAVPDATEAQIHHQLEYIPVYLSARDRTYHIDSAGQKATFLGPFKGMDKALRPKIMGALATYLNDRVTELATRVRDALTRLNATGHSLWLRRDKRYPVRSEFLGLKVRIHGSGEEFVLAGPYYDKVAFLEGGDGSDLEEAAAKRRANLLLWRQERERCSKK